MFDLNGQLEESSSRLGDGVLGMSVEDYLSWLIDWESLSTLAAIIPYTGILECRKHEEGSWAYASMLLCFLSVKAPGPVSSGPCCRDPPTPIDCILKIWAEINPHSLYLHSSGSFMTATGKSQDDFKGIPLQLNIHKWLQLEHCLS